MSPTLTTQDSPLQIDLTCIKCHYNLRTKRPTELCPECAYPVADSIRLHLAASLPHPKRAALGSLLLALYYLHYPLSSLAYFILYTWLALTPSTLNTILFTALSFLAGVSACTGFFLLRAGIQSTRPSLASRLFAILVVSQTLLLPATITIISLVSPWTYITPLGASGVPWLPLIVEIAQFTFTLILYFTALRPLRRLALRLNRPAFALIISSLIPAYMLIYALELLIMCVILYTDLGKEIAWKWLTFINYFESTATLAIYSALALYWLTFAHILRKTPVQSPQPTTIPP